MSSPPQSCEATAGGKASELQEGLTPSPPGKDADASALPPRTEVHDVDACVGPAGKDFTETTAESTAAGKAEAPTGTASAAARPKLPAKRQEQDAKRGASYYDEAVAHRAWHPAAPSSCGGSAPPMVMLQPMMMPQPPMPGSQMMMMMPPQAQQFLGAGPALATNAMFGAPPAAMYPLYPFGHVPHPSTMNFRVRMPSVRSAVVAPSSHRPTPPPPRLTSLPSAVLAFRFTYSQPPPVPPPLVEMPPPDPAVMPPGTYGPPLQPTSTSMPHSGARRSAAMHAFPPRAVAVPGGGQEQHPTRAGQRRAVGGAAGAASRSVASAVSTSEGEPTHGDGEDVRGGGRKARKAERKAELRKADRKALGLSSPDLEAQQKGHGGNGPLLPASAPSVLTPGSPAADDGASDGDITDATALAATAAAEPATASLIAASSFGVSAAGGHRRCESASSVSSIFGGSASIASSAPTVRADASDACGSVSTCLSGADSECGELHVLQLRLTNSQIGALMGPGGVRMKALREGSGAQVRVEPPAATGTSPAADAPPEERRMTIVGSKAAVAMAHELLAPTLQGWDFGYTLTVAADEEEANQMLNAGRGHGAVPSSSRGVEDQQRPRKTASAGDPHGPPGQHRGQQAHGFEEAQQLRMQGHDMSIPANVYLQQQFGLAGQPPPMMALQWSAGMHPMHPMYPPGHCGLPPSVGHGHLLPPQTMHAGPPLPPYVGCVPSPHMMACSMPCPMHCNDNMAAAANSQRRQHAREQQAAARSAPSERAKLREQTRRKGQTAPVLVDHARKAPDAPTPEAAADATLEVVVLPEAAPADPDTVAPSDEVEAPSESSGPSAGPDAQSAIDVTDEVPQSGSTESEPEPSAADPVVTASDPAPTGEEQAVEEPEGEVSSGDAAVQTGVATPAVEAPSPAGDKPQGPEDGQTVEESDASAPAPLAAAHALPPGATWASRGASGPAAAPASAREVRAAGTEDWPALGMAPVPRRLGQQQSIAATLTGGAVDKEQAITAMADPEAVVKSIKSLSVVDRIEGAPLPASARRDSRGDTELGDLPQELVCPITMNVMSDPVFTSDGQTYERRAIEEWLTTHDTSPLTGAVLTSAVLTPNVTLRSYIDRLISERKLAASTIVEADASK